LATAHVRPASVVNKAADGTGDRTLSATITHDAMVAHDTLAQPKREGTPVASDGMRTATFIALGALVEDQVRPPSLVSDMNQDQSDFGGADSLKVRTEQLLGLAHCTPLIGWPGSAT
jgi:hypothetical protein